MSEIPSAGAQADRPSGEAREVMRYERKPLWSSLAALAFALACCGLAIGSLRAAGGIVPWLFLGIALLTVGFLFRSRLGRRRQSLTLEGDLLIQTDEQDGNSFRLALRSIDRCEIREWTDGAPDMELISSQGRFRLVPLPRGFRIALLARLSDAKIPVTHR